MENEMLFGSVNRKKKRAICRIILPLISTGANESVGFWINESRTIRKDYVVSPSAIYALAISPTLLPALSSTILLRFIENQTCYMMSPPLLPLVFRSFRVNVLVLVGCLHFLHLGSQIVPKT